MFWSTINFDTLTKLLLPTFLRNSKTMAFFQSIAVPMQQSCDDTLYRLQHSGIKIDLEKVLNEHFNIIGYNHQNHENTKLIYIDDLPVQDKLYIFQNEETDTSFLEDDSNDNEDDIFLDGDDENFVAYSWIVFIPNTILFNEYTLRALIDSYRYLGKKYNIQTYVL